MSSPPILDEIHVKAYDFDDHSFHTHAQQRGLGPAGIINPPEEAGGHSFIPFNVEDRDFHINILPPTPLELFQLFTPISLVQSWVYYSESWVSHLIQNGVIDSYNTAISDHSRINKWDGLSVAQVYVWLGLLIYLGIHKENTIKSHWSSPSLGVQSPLHPAELQSTPLNPLAEPVEWMDLNPRSPSV